MTADRSVALRKIGNRQSAEQTRRYQLLGQLSGPLRRFLATESGSALLMVEEFLRDIDEQRHAFRIRDDVADAEASGARGTPTFFVGNRRHQGPHGARTLIAALEAAQ